MTKYKQTLDWLFTRIPMFQRTGAAAYKKDLHNIRRLCAAFGNPQEQFPHIHIAGTNGKGSTAHLTAAVMQAHGLKTGLYTSPHYRDFRERIKIDGKFISRKTVIDFTDRHIALFEEMQPSFFEITVAMAFHYFAEQKVDIAVIETGLGGRLDSTNIITPLLSVITNIGYDHQMFLGDTLPLIAAEKAGIIKKNVPVIIGETHPDTEPVFRRKAAEMNAPIYFADQFIRAEELPSVPDPEAEEDYGKNLHRTVRTTFSVKIGEDMQDDYDVNLIGSYQAKNLQTVLQMLFVLPEVWPAFTPEREKIQYALQNLKSLTNFIGRWHLLGTQPMIIADSAHNEQGIAVALRQINAVRFNNLHIVLGMVNDKEIDKILQMLPRSATYYYAKADIPRGLPAAELAQKGQSHELRGKTYSSVRNALAAARRRAEEEDFIYVGGSTFTVAEVV